MNKTIDCVVLVTLFIIKSDICYYKLLCKITGDPDNVEDYGWGQYKITLSFVDYSKIAVIKQAVHLLELYGINREINTIVVY